MEILKRARKATDGEIVPWNENAKSVREEVNRRTHKAGYTDRDGQPRRQKEIVSNLSAIPADRYRLAFGHD